ncbi:glycosyltransferase family 4 protein [Natronomonas amylolytica]|uniref:glycosyltransferase family 4 protein n=1 Tax=Natronomonas amylolytica TaxID=3108498 RepID=UPI00300940E7
MSATVFVTVVDLSTISGSGVATREIIRGVGAVSDDRLVVLCPEPTDAFPDRLKAIVDEFVFLPEMTNPGSPRWHLQMEVSILRKLWTVLRTENPSVVVTRLSPSTLFPTPLCKLFNVPHVLLIRGWVRRQDEYGGTKFGRGVEELVRMNVRLSTNVYVAFDELKTWIDPYRGGSQSPVEVLPNAVDPTLFSSQSIGEARSEIGIETDDFIVGFVGSLAPRHEVSTLLHAASHLDDVELLLVGDGELREELEQLATDLGIQDRVIFTGQVPHERVPTYIASFDAGYGVVSPGKASNPIKCYEYLACERPVITSQKDEFEFVSEIDTGEVVESVSSEGVQNAIKRLQRRSQADRLAAGERGRRYVRQHHTWEAVGERILEDREQ